MNQQEKIVLYSDILAAIKKRVSINHWYGGICPYLPRDTFPTRCSDDSLSELYAELYAYKPDNKRALEYWWDPYDGDIRIEVLNEIITKLKNQ